MLFNLSILSSESITNQLTSQFLNRILYDNYYDGKELPSPRMLAAEQHVSLHSIENAYIQLGKNDLIIENNGIYRIPYFTAEQKNRIRERYYNSYSPVKVLEEFSKSINSIIDKARLSELLIESLKTNLLIEKSVLLFADNLVFQHLSQNKNINDLLVRNSNELFSLSEQVKNQLDSKTRNFVDQNNIQLLIALKNHDEIFGILALSAKNNSMSYTQQDLDTIIILISQFVAGYTTADYYKQLIEKRRLEEQLEIARQIQAKLLPQNLPNNQLVNIAAYSTSLQTVGGDFYDCFELDEQNIVLVIADACGKGLPAAMLISQIQSMLRSEIASGKDLSTIMEELNRRVVTFMPKGKFVTLFMGIYNIEDSTFKYANAGHNHPLLIADQNVITCLNNSGPALGIIPDSTFDMTTIHISANSLLCLYTDGITEVMNNEDEEFGETRLLKIIQQDHKKTTEEITASVIESINKFADDSAFTDDRTILILKNTNITKNTI